MDQDQPPRDVIARRRAIARAVDHKPGITVEELRGLLSLLGNQPGPAELADDLKSQGLTIDLTGDGPPRVVPRPPERWAEPDWAPVDAAPPYDIPDEAEPSDDEAILGRPLPVLVAVVLGAVLLVAGVLWATDPDDEQDALATAVPASATTDPPATATTVPTTPSTAPPGDPALAGGGDGADDFERPDGPGLGTGPAGPWEVASGSWTVATGQALAPGTFGQDDAPPSVALVGPESADVRVQVRAVRLVSNGGLVFRYEDPENFWLVSAAPQLSTFALARVRDGERILVGNVGLVATEGRTATIGVNAIGTTVEVLVDGRVVRTFTDTVPGDGARFGLGVLGGAAEARFDDFVFDVP